MKLEELEHDEVLNRIIQLRAMDRAPQPGIGKMYFDKATNKVKIYIGDGGWADVVVTTTSTSTSTSTTTT